MKIIIIYCITCISGVSAPLPEMPIAKISGDIVYGRWVKHEGTKLADVVMDGEPARRDLKEAPYLMIVLKSLKGVDDILVKRLNSEFLYFLDQIGDLHYLDYNIRISLQKPKVSKNGFLLLLIPCEDLPKKIRLGNEVTIANIVFQSDDFGGKIIKCDEMRISE